MSFSLVMRVKIPERDACLALSELLIIITVFSKDKFCILMVPYVLNRSQQYAKIVLNLGLTLTGKTALI